MKLTSAAIATVVVATLVEALVQRCQDDWHERWLATLDPSWHRPLREQLRAMFPDLCVWQRGSRLIPKCDELLEDGEACACQYCSGHRWTFCHECGRRGDRSDDVTSPHLCEMAARPGA